jgi:hypothetical protein
LSGKASVRAVGYQQAFNRPPFNESLPSCVL